MSLLPSTAASTDAPEDDLTPQQRAFIRSAAPGDLLGVELKPLDALRMTAALGMGLKYGMVSDDDLIEITQQVPVEEEPEKPEPAAKGKKLKPGAKAKPAKAAAKGGEPKMKSQTVVIYNAFLADVITVLWLCSNENSVAFKARRKIEWAILESTRWADAKGIRLGHPNFAKAAAIFGQIMRDVENSRSEPEEEAGGETEPGN